MNTQPTPPQIENKKVGPFPGKWELRSRSMCDNSLVVTTRWESVNGDHEICLIREGKWREYGPENDRDIANGRLIATAPDLLASLKDLNEYLNAVANQLPVGELSAVLEKVKSSADVIDAATKAP